MFPSLLRIKKLLESIPQVQRVFVNRKVEENVSEYYLEAKEGCDVRREVFKKLAARNYPILMMRSNVGSSRISTFGFPTSACAKPTLCL